MEVHGGGAHTVRLRRVPEHHAAEGRVLVARRDRDAAESRHVDVAGAGRGGVGGRADVDLDVLVDRGGLGPVVPVGEVPVVRVVEVRQAAEVVVELDVDRVERCRVQDPVCTWRSARRSEIGRYGTLRRLTWTCRHRGRGIGAQQRSSRSCLCLMRGCGCG